jgi:hypothetical protein
MKLIGRSHNERLNFFFRSSKKKFWGKLHGFKSAVAVMQEQSDQRYDELRRALNGQIASV